MIDDVSGVASSGIGVTLIGAAHAVYSPRILAPQSLAERIPRELIAEQIVGTSAPARNARSASIILRATSANDGDGGNPKSASITIVSVVFFPIARKISRNA